MDQIRDETFHLTASGWSTGNRPKGAVETWRRWSYEEPRRHRKNVGWTSVWADPGLSRADRDDLRRKFPDLMGREGRDGELTITVGGPI